MTTIADLKKHADDALYANRHAEALAIYGRMVELQPSNLEARLRVADALLGLGEVQRAAVVYASLARHAALACYPLRSLVAIKVLASLDPQLGSLMREVGQLYSRESTRLGRSARTSLPDLTQAVPQAAPLALAPGADLPARAGAIAAGYTQGDLVFPEKVMPIPVLSLLSTDQFATALNSIRLLRVRPGAAIIEQGADGSSFFVLTRGRVQVSNRSLEGEERVLATLHEGAIFGEMSLLTSAPRTASVHALDDCDLLEFDREDLKAASETMASLGQALGSFAQERLLNNVMSTAMLFQPLDYQQRDDLMRRFVAVHANANDQIIEQGKPGNGLYVVLRGMVEVRRETDGVTEVLATLGPGDTFGEISLINDAPTTASVVAVESTTVLFLGRHYCERLIAAIPEIREYLERLAEGRVMDTFRRMSRVSQPTAAGDAGDYEELSDFEVLI